MSRSEKTELLGLDRLELEEYMLGLGESRFRGRQLYRWIYIKDTSSFYEMSDLPLEMRKDLDNKARISIPRVLKQRVSQDGTRKFLLEMKDKKKVETVLIPQETKPTWRYTICVSSQVGCPLRCAFCATGQGTYQRNLTAPEIVGQVLGSRRELRRRFKNNQEAVLANVVYMGMGEPLLNYDEVIRSVRTINDPRGVQIGQRHITISTCGEAKGILRLAEEGLQLTLAVSLHAATDALRDQLVPLNKVYPIKELIAAVKTYIEKTGRRVTFEYIMLDGVNIDRSDAERLAELVGPLLANVNLIPYNEVDGLPFRRPDIHRVKQFYTWLIGAGLNVSVRQEYGGDIEAACGQLALKTD